MVRSSFHIILCLLIFLISSRDIKSQTISEINNVNSGLSSNQILRDSVYHAGVLMVLNLNGEARYTRSSFCLSCHDGIFVKSGHSVTNIGNPENIEEGAIFRFDHPVAFEYSRTLSLEKSYLNDPYSMPSGLGGTVAEDLLVEGRIECVSCHNIMFKEGEMGEYATLIKNNRRSSLCLTCHNR